MCLPLGDDGGTGPCSSCLPLPLTAPSCGCQVRRVIELKRKVCDSPDKSFVVINQKGIDPISLDMFAKEVRAGAHLTPVSRPKSKHPAPPAGPPFPLVFRGAPESLGCV